MTKKDILAEKKDLRKRSRLLINEIMAETDQSIALTKLEELTALNSRIATLDAMYTRIISDEYDRTINKLLDKIMKRA